MPDLRAVIEDLRAALKRQADALAAVEQQPDSARAYEALNAANRALVKEAYCHLPALLDAAERGLEAEAADDAEDAITVRLRKARKAEREWIAEAFDAHDPTLAEYIRTMPSWSANHHAPPREGA